MHAVQVYASVDRRACRERRRLRMLGAGQRVCPGFKVERGRE